MKLKMTFFVFGAVICLSLPKTVYATTPVFIETCLSKNNDELDKSLKNLKWANPSSNSKVKFEEKMSRCIVNEIFISLKKIKIKTLTTQNIAINNASTSGNNKIQQATAATISGTAKPKGGSFTDKAAYALYLSANKKVKEELNAYLMSLYIDKLCSGNSGAAKKMSLRFTCEALDTTNSLIPNIEILKASIIKDILRYPFHVKVYDCMHKITSIDNYYGCATINNNIESAQTMAMKIVYRSSYLPYYSSIIELLENIVNTSQLKIEFENIELEFIEDIAKYAAVLDKKTSAMTQQQLIFSFISGLTERITLATEIEKKLKVIRVVCKDEAGVLDECIKKLGINLENYPSLKKILYKDLPEDFELHNLKSFLTNLDDLNAMFNIYGHISDKDYSSALNYGIRRYSIGGNLQEYTNAMFWAVDIANSADYSDIQHKLSDLFSEHGTHIYLGNSNQKTFGLFAAIGYSYMDFKTDSLKSESQLSTKVGIRYSFGTGKRYFGPRFTVFDFTSSFSGDNAPDDLDGFAKSSFSPSIDFEFTPFAKTPLNISIGYGERRPYDSVTKTSGEKEKYWRIGIEFTTNLLSF